MKKLSKMAGKTQPLIEQTASCVSSQLLVMPRKFTILFYFSLFLVVKDLTKKPAEVSRYLHLLVSPFTVVDAMAYK